MNIQSLNFSVDINRDGHYSAWELWDILKVVYRLPGNLLVEGLGHIPPIASLLNIDATPANGYGSLDGLLSVTLSLLFWIIVIFGMLTLASPKAEEDDDLLHENTENHAKDKTSFGAGSVLPANTATTRANALLRPATRRHHPVSRPVYAASGKKPKHHPWHHITASLFRHVKP